MGCAASCVQPYLKLSQAMTPMDPSSSPATRSHGIVL
jgi:hypothetical protein